LVYGAGAPLPPEAEQILARQLHRALGVPDATIRVFHVALLPQPLSGGETLAEAAEMLQRYPALRAEITGAPTDTAAIPAAVERLVQAGVVRNRIGTRTASGAALQIRLHTGTEE
jgi:hypothetical protein